MEPYRNVRYWLSDLVSGGCPIMEEELFNHAHVKLRNLIDRWFDVLKACFPIMKGMMSCPFRVR